MLSASRRATGAVKAASNPLLVAAGARARDLSTAAHGAEHGQPGHLCNHRCMATSSQNNTNKGVVYVKPGVTEVRSIDYPKLELLEQKRKCHHGVILKVVATNICGSDQHMVRGRTTAPEGLVLGHEVRFGGGLSLFRIY